MKNICILGSTGSIGRNALEVIAGFPDEFRVVALTANSNAKLLREQVARFRPAAAGLLDEKAALELKKHVNGSTSVHAGSDGLCEITGRDDIDIVVSAHVGFAGLRPTLEAVKRGRVVALANKETLVAAGAIMTRLAREHRAAILPIDSEHSAILQCLAGEELSHVARLILTASGGPFLHLHKSEFAAVTVERALRHPNWKMGDKITIDSATMMNKGLEVIEAHWLFDLPVGKIDVLVHPQSIIHSMVEFVDGSVKAQLGVPDMKIPIQYALTWPRRAPSPFARLDLAALREMTFFAPDHDKFECVALAADALRAGGTTPAILNAANEVAVRLFLDRAITFDRIPAVIGRALEGVPSTQSPSLEEIFAADAETRKFLARMQFKGAAAAHA